MQRTKEERIKYLIVAFTYFLSIIFANIGLVFKPLYSKVYYGIPNKVFYFGISAGILFVLLFVIEFVLKRKLHVTYEKDKTPLSIKMVCIILLIIFALVFIVSALIGFHVKPFYDLGENLTKFKLFYEVGVKHIYYVILCMYIVMITENFQYALDKSIIIKNEKVEQYIPYGGICTMLTFGIYSLIMLDGSLKVLFFFMCIIYGELYLLCKRNILKSYFAILMVFLF